MNRRLPGLAWRALLLVGSLWFLWSPPGLPRAGAQSREARSLDTTGTSNGTRSLRPQRVTSSFFRELSSPGARRVRRLIAQAHWLRKAADRLGPSEWENTCRKARSLGAHIDHAENPRASIRTVWQLARKALTRRAGFDNALARLERAHRLAPRDPSVAYELAETLARWEEPGPLWGCGARRRTDEAIAAFQRVAAIDPTFRPAMVATSLAILHTRKRDYVRALSAHQQAIAMSLASDASAITNLAEVTMLAGDLESALARYRQGLRAARDDRERALALWGIAITLDRLGETDDARAHAGQALQVEGGRMTFLRSSGVFFEPQRELDYYEALGHEARISLSPDQARSARRAAIRSWQQYLSQAPPSDPFIANVRTNLARLEATPDDDKP